MLRHGIRRLGSYFSDSGRDDRWCSKLSLDHHVHRKRQRKCRMVQNLESSMDPTQSDTGPQVSYWLGQQPWRILHWHAARYPCTIEVHPAYRPHLSLFGHAGSMTVASTPATSSSMSLASLISHPSHIRLRVRFICGPKKVQLDFSARQCCSSLCPGTKKKVEMSQT